MLRKQSNEFWQLGQLLDLGNVSEVACQNRRQIRSGPILPSPFALTADRLGKTAQQHKFDKIITDNRLTVPMQFPCKQALKEIRRLACYFRASKREHPNGFHPARQTVRNPRQRKHIRRPGQEETAGPIVFVNRLLDCQQQIRRALNLIDDGTIETANETNRIGPRGIKHRLVIECDIAPPSLTHLPHKGGLARPAWPYDFRTTGVSERASTTRFSTRRSNISVANSLPIGIINHDNWKSMPHQLVMEELKSAIRRIRSAREQPQRRMR
ncbi:Uncharacterised protein [Agrobacterium tumefaciens]|nr:Uncharacterised protein [Agrobacterium tumefaciens]